MTDTSFSTKGFTLIEMLVVISIIGIFSTFLLINTGEAQGRAEVENVAHQVLNIVKDARQRAVSVEGLAAYGYDNYPNYGLNFDMTAPSKITLYADCVSDDNGDDIVDNRDHFKEESNCGGRNNESGRLEDILLKHGAKISSLCFVDTTEANPSCSSEDELFFEYVRPEPTVWISDGSSVMPTGRIELTLTDTTEGYTKTVVLTTTGLSFIK